MGAITFSYDAEAGGFRFTLDGAEHPVIPALQGDDLKRWHAMYARAYIDLGDALPATRTFPDRMRVYNAAEDDWSMP